MGWFPVKFPNYNLNYENNSVITVQVGFTIDKIEYEWF
jgi:hypothetical protein